MKNNIFSFIKNNNKIIFEKKSDNQSTLVIDRGNFYPAFMDSLYASVTNNKYNHRIITLVSDSKNKTINNFYESFGENKLILNLFNLKNFFLYVKTLFQTLYICILIKKNGIEWFVNNYKFNKIYVGDMIYDTYIGNNNRYLNPKIDINFLKILISTIHKVYLIQKIIENYKVKIIIINQDVSASNGAIALRLGNFKRLRIIEPATDLKNDHFFFEYNNHKVKHGAYNFYYRFLYKKKNCIKKLKISKKKLNRFIINRYGGKTKLAYTGSVDLSSANKKKIIFSKNKLINHYNIKNKIDRIVVLACHSFSDAPHGQGKNIIFQDYYAHVKETLIFLKKIKFENVLWMIRPHPASKRYGEEGIVEKLFKDIIKDNNSLVKMCPKNLDTSDLIKCCDLVITMKGTIGLEFASEGKPSICCNEAPYSNLGISIEVKDKKSYFKKLANINKIPKKLSKSKTYKAKKILYIFEKSIPENYISQSKIFTKSILAKRYQNKNLYFFNKSLLNKLRNKKLNNDTFYKDLYKKL